MAIKTRYTVIDGEVIAEKRGGVRKEYVPDPLGSTVALLDNAQTQTDTFAYWPYGEEANRTGTTPAPFRFVGTQGYYHDSITRTYVRARYFDALKGRWMTEDPIGFDSSDYNLSQYVNSRPTTFADPSGLMPPFGLLPICFPPGSPPPPVWPRPPGPVWPIDDCTSYGPGSGLPVHKVIENCISCCERVFGGAHNSPRRLERCKYCCTQWNTGGADRRHCLGTWPRFPKPPGMPPQGCPPGTVWSSK